MAKRFYVVHTHQNCEQMAEENLNNQFPGRAFLPHYTEECIPSRHSKWRESTIIHPLYETYLFLQLDLEVDRWRSVNGTRGVQRILGAVEQPIAVPQGFVENLMKACAVGFHDIKLPQVARVRPGDVIQMKRGAFASFIGKCLRARKDELRVDLNVFGRVVEATVMARDVELLHA